MVDAQDINKPLGRNSNCSCSLPKSMAISRRLSLALTCHPSAIPAARAWERVLFCHVAGKGWSFEKTALEGLYLDHHPPLLGSCCLALNQSLARHGSSSRTRLFAQADVVPCSVFVDCPRAEQGAVLRAAVVYITLQTEI